MRDMSMGSQERKSDEFIVASNEAGLRLDIYLSLKDLGLSRSQIKKSVDDRLVRVNGVHAKVSHRLRPEDIVEIDKREPVACHALPQDIPLTIIYEDQHILVVDKPAGMVVHPAVGNVQDTMVNAILHHCPNLSGIGAEFHPEAQLLHEKRQAPPDIAHGENGAEGLESCRHGASHFRRLLPITPA